MTSSDSFQRATLAKMSPFFLVDDIPKTVDFYRDMLGFDVVYSTPEAQPFFVMLSRDNCSIMFKDVGVSSQTLKRFENEAESTCDGYWHVNPDLLYAEFKAKGIKITRELADTEHGTREFEFEDINGYAFVCGTTR